MGEHPDPDDIARSDAPAPTRRYGGFVAAVIALAVGAGFVAFAVTKAARVNAPGIAIPPASSILGEGDRAPLHFELARLGAGPALNLASIAHGHPTVINFFASWCPNCTAELQAFGLTSHHFAGQATFIGVDTNDTAPSTALALIRRAGITYPIGRDTANGTVLSAYGASALPVTFFIDAKGRVSQLVLGRQDRQQLTTRVNALLATSSPART